MEERGNLTPAERLARYDRMYADLLAERQRACAEMDRLRAEEKTRTVTYRQLLVNKLLVQNFIGRLETYGL